MRRGGALLAAALAVSLAAGCAGGPPAAPRNADPTLASIVVRIEGRAKEGLRRPRAGEPDYDETTAGPAFAKVNYRRLPDVAVALRGEGLPERGPSPAEAALRARARGFDRALVLLGPRGTTCLTIRNDRDAAISLFCAGESGDGFDVSIEPGAESRVSLSDPGLYELACAEDDALRAEILVAETCWAAVGAAGREVAFEGLPPGEYEVTVRAARLPPVVRRVRAEAGARAAVEATLGVNDLPKARPDR